MWLEDRDKERADESCISLWGSHAILYEALPADEEEEGGTAGMSGLAPVLSPGVGLHHQEGMPSPGFMGPVVLASPQVRAVVLVNCSVMYRMWH